MCLTGCLQADKLYEDSSEKLSETDNTSKSNTFYRISPSMGYFSYTIASAQDGAYSLRFNTDGSANILYYDYSSTQLIYLSNQTTPTKDETNPGWLENTLGGAYILCDDEHLYILKVEMLPKLSIDYQGDPAYIMRTGLTGQDKVKVVLPNYYALVPGSAVISDGSSLYIIVYRFDLEDMGKSWPVLCRVDFSKKSVEELYTFPAEAEYNLRGGFADNLLIESAAFSENANRVAHELLTYSVSKDDISKAVVAWTNDEKSRVYDNKGMYYIDTGSFELHYVDAITGQNSVICENISTPLGESTSGYSAYIADEIYDNHLILRFNGNGQIRYFSYDLITGEMLPIDLYYEEDNGQTKRLAAILGENDKYFLVIYGSKAVKSQTVIEGKSVQFDEYVVLYKLIEKQAYWQSKPDFLEFEDYVYNR